MQSNSKKTTSSTSPYTEPQGFLLQTYLRNALCPAPSSSSSFGGGDRVNGGGVQGNGGAHGGGGGGGTVQLRDRVKEGSFYGGCDGARWKDWKGVKVLELDIWDFRTMVRQYIDSSPDIFLTTSSHPFLHHLPCYGLSSLSPSQTSFLHRINSQDDFILLIITFVLSPITHCCRIMHNIPVHVPMAKGFEFIATRGPNQKPDGDWDVLRIPATMYGEGSLSIICIPPWKVDLDDLRAFTMPDIIPPPLCNHPRFAPTSTSAQHTAYELWNTVLEVCKPAGPCFVVTNYLFWCFGRFEALESNANEENRKGKGKGKERERHSVRPSATVSPPIELETSIPNSIRLPMRTEPMGLGCTIPECLLFWIQMTRGVAGWMEG
ncbi:hypothetical protein J3R30DRAFT_3540169 [Lentinula aciculospora]|uniref:Uncharacterized protein n=1 Tax=Lentinula aciculospora TaxID=153920 RepID=A0A9W9DH10_9AGAR|nr:hypothetical protein J3R30DRAFT_3540169 [Lentinula aciculospora]